MRKIINLLYFILALGLPVYVQANIDLVTLPDRDKTELTIYNSADLTLVREQRTLTLKKGINRLEFGWENTLIDPTSVQLRAPANEGKVRLQEVIFQNNIKGSAIWLIESDIEGPVPVEITFFTSGLNWHAYYMGTLSNDEKILQLQGYVRINNHSGEDYEKASTRVIVGNIHLIDEISALARRDSPYNQPGQNNRFVMTQAKDEFKARAYSELLEADVMAPASKAAKKIIKRGLSEYFIYDIEGTENIMNGWGKRLPSFNVENIPVKNLYRYEEERYGINTQRLVIFNNNKKHKLGKEPLPNGNIQVFKNQGGKQQQLGFVGSINTKYIPVDQDVELDFGPSHEVKIEPVLMADKTGNYMFDRKGNISGFDRTQSWEIKLENNRDLPVKIEVNRNFNHTYWDINNQDKNAAQFKKIDIDSVQYSLELPPRSSKTIAYQLIQYEGERQHTR